MDGVVKGLDKAMQSMDLEKVCYFLSNSSGPSCGKPDQAYPSQCRLIHLNCCLFSDQKRFPQDF